MTKSRISLLAIGVFLATACQQLPASTKPLTVRSDSTRWECPPGQPCDGKPDYRALLSHDSGQEIYLSFGPDLKPPYDKAKLKQHFRFGDIYLTTAQGTIAIHIDTSENGEANIEFMPSPAGRLQGRVSARRYRLQTEGKPGPDCKTDDIKGFCREEKRMDTPLNLQLDLALP
ncbi:hypothetical protein [Chitinimonas naiadis]